jgi:hypothetical protein
MPILVYALIRTNKEYRTEDSVLEEGAALEACQVPVLRRHAVVILVDRIDLATARAIQYARSLMPQDLRAVHFNVDERRAQMLIDRWQHLGLSQLPLDVIDTPDRRLTRAALELAAEMADGETEVTILLPRRSYGRAWRRVLHDQTADRIVDAVSQLSHVNATIVPFLVASSLESKRRVPTVEELGLDRLEPIAAKPERPRTVPLPTVPGATPITNLRWRQRARVAGRVKTLRVQPMSGVPSLECTLVDASGEALLVVFLGRRSIGGIETGTRMLVEGTVGKYRDRLAMINPMYELLSPAQSSDSQPA